MVDNSRIIIIVVVVGVGRRYQCFVTKQAIKILCLSQQMPRFQEYGFDALENFLITTRSRRIWTIKWLWIHVEKQQQQQWIHVGGFGNRSCDFNFTFNAQLFEIALVFVIVKFATLFDGYESSRSYWYCKAIKPAKKSNEYDDYKKGEEDAIDRSNLQLHLLEIAVIFQKIAKQFAQRLLIFRSSGLQQITHIHKLYTIYVVNALWKCVKKWLKEIIITHTHRAMIFDRMCL